MNSSEKSLEKSSPITGAAGGRVPDLRAGFKSAFGPLVPALGTQGRLERVRPQRLTLFHHIDVCAR